MISRIGHVGLQVTDLEGSIEFAERVLGLRVSERDDTTAYLTCNERHHELMLHQGPHAGCHHLAVEVFDRRSLEQVLEALERRGLPTQQAPAERGVTESVRFIAPGGFLFEVFYGMERTQPQHYATVGVRPRKFEHITVKSSVKDELEVFLQEVLGMRVSDRAEDQITWLRANDEHHGFSVIRADVDQLQHYAWQVDWESIRRVGDQLLQRGQGFLWGPGHHGIGDNYFSYFIDPGGTIVEYSADIQRIENEATYQPRTWPDEPLSVNCWGNPPPPLEFLHGGVPLIPAEIGTVTK